MSENTALTTVRPITPALEANVDQQKSVVDAVYDEHVYANTIASKVGGVNKRRTRHSFSPNESRSRVQALSKVSDMIKSDPHSSKEVEKFAGLGAMINKITPEERDLFFVLLDEFIKDNPDYNTTHDAWSVYRFIMNEIRLIRLNEFELQDYLRAKESGFIDAPKFMFKESSSILNEMSKLASDGHISRSAKNSIGSGIRITIASIANNVSKERVSAIQSMYCQEEDMFLTQTSQQQDVLLGYEQNAYDSTEVVLQQLADNSETRIKKTSDISYAQAEKSGTD